MVITIIPHMPVLFIAFSRYNTFFFLALYIVTTVSVTEAIIKIAVPMQKLLTSTAAYGIRNMSAKE